MEDIGYVNDELLTISSRTELFDISMYKDKDYLKSIENFVKFVSACEKFIRSSSEYSNFKAQLFEMGLTKCQVLGHIEADEFGQVTVEMHHGPILTLFDYCAIVIDSLLARNEKVNSFRVARIVLDEHFEGNVQTVMLSKTVHQEVDSGRLFISFDQARGNLNNFLQKYSDGLNEERIQKINRYIELSEEYGTFDNGLFDLKNTLTDWNYDVAKSRVKESK